MVLQYEFIEENRENITMTTLTLRQARANKGMTAQAVATATDCDRATLYRIEAGESQPRRETARALFELYNRQVPLASIYDPEYADLIAAA